MARSLLNAMGPRDMGALLARLLAIADDAVIIVDQAQRIVLFNEGAERIFGRRVDDVLGQPLDLLLPQAARLAHARHMHEFAQSGTAARRMGDRRDVHGLRADGSLFDAEASISHVELDGQTYFTAILRDVTERHAQSQALERAKSAAEAAARAKSLFLANMSHEIRTPLNAVIGMTTLLLDTPMSEDQRDFARTIRASGDSLLEIINDILDYSKADVGKLEIERRPFDLRQLVEQSLDLVTPRALEKNLNLAYLIEDGTPEALIGDLARVRQILVNLLSNAVKFTHQGEVLVSVDARSVDDETVDVHFAVRDTGIGIAAEQLPRLFQSFTQVDASTTRKYGGTGLGLAISKRLAELMGGSVAADSEPGHGSTFHATVRLQTAQPALQPDFLQRNAPALTGKRILIVDDNLTNRRIVTKLVLRWGMLPSTLPSALEAMDRIRHGEPFDIALLDMSMPEVDGLDLAAEIRRLRTPLELPIVMLTSLGQRQAGQLHGLAACLSKPIKAGVLFSTLVAVLEGSCTGAPPPAPLAPQTHPQPDVALRVLVAEDNPINQRVTMRLLQHLGYTADLVCDGRQAVAAVEHRPYDVVLMDIQMPELDGVQAAREIVARRGDATAPRLSNRDPVSRAYPLADFGLTDPKDSPANVLLAVTLNTLPAGGSLSLNGVAASPGQSVAAADIAGGLLRFTPAANANGAGYASFTFSVQDDGGTANAGVDLDASPNTITVNVSAVNDAPVNGAPGSQTLARNTALVFSAAVGNAVTVSDPDAGGAALRLTLTATNGNLTLAGVAGLAAIPERDFTPEGAASANSAMLVALSTLLRLFAPYLPFVTEEVWSWWRPGSVHRASWPTSDEVLAPIGGRDAAAVQVSMQCQLALTEVRRVKALHKKTAKTVIDRAVLPSALESLGPAARDFQAAMHIRTLSFGDVAEANLTFVEEPSA